MSGERLSFGQKKQFVCVFCECPSDGSKLLEPVVRKTESTGICFSCSWFIGRAFMESLGFKAESWKHSEIQMIGEIPATVFDDFCRNGWEAVSAPPPPADERRERISSVAVVKTKIEIEGLGFGFVQEYPDRRCWAYLSEPYKKLGSFPDRSAAEEAVRLAITQRASENSSVLR